MLSLLTGLTFFSVLAPSAFDERLPVVHRVELAIRVDPADGFVRSSCDLSIEAPGDAEVTRVPLLLHHRFQVESVELDGAPVAFEATRGRRLDATEVVLTLDDPIPAGEQRALSIRYGGRPTDRADSRFTVLRSGLLAFPEVGRASDGSRPSTSTYDYELHVTVPEGFVVASGGRRIGRVAADGGATYSYRSVEPSDRIDIAVARYLEIEGVRARVFCLPEHEEGARRMLGTVNRVMDLYTAWFGPLLDDRALAVIEVPAGTDLRADAMTILQPEPAFVGAADSALLYGEAAQLWCPRPLDPEPCRVETDGLAAFVQDLACRALDGDEEALDRGWDRARMSFLAACERSPELETMHLADLGKHGLTGVAKSKGAMYFRVLYELVGHDDFLSIVRHLYTMLGAKGATLSRWARTAQGGTHKDILHSYDDWLFGDHSTEFIRRRKSPREIADHYVD